MGLSTVSESVMLHVLNRYSNRKLQPTPCRGGLSPIVLRRVKNFLETALMTGITILVLTEQAGLSPFHFTRMFSESEGLSPHQYVFTRRISGQRVYSGDNPFAGSNCTGMWLQ